MKITMKNITIFASGNGTNAERIIKYFMDNSKADVVLILSNKPDAGVLMRAKKLDIETVVFNRNTFYNTNDVVEILENNNTDLIVLAGFLWLVPDNILNNYRDRILNIHPALLPKYGGKGMFGHHVHEAVIGAGEKMSGITIHYVNEKYDDGQIVFQKKLDVLPDDTPDSLASRIHKLEYEFYPKVIEEVIARL